MTILTPILYADGALRLTDHGLRGGGLVLVHVPSGQQVSIPEGEQLAVEQIIVETDRDHLGGIIHDLLDTYAWYEPNKPAFRPFRHG